MIEIPRILAGRLRSLCRRIGLRTSTNSNPPVYFDASADGLVIRALAHDAALEYHHRGEFAARSFAIPLSALAEAEGTTHQMIALAPHADGGTRIEWPEGPIPQQRVVDDVGSLPDDFPKFPGNLTANPAPLADALRSALASADRQASARYALHALKLEGATSRIVATDGHQLLVQGGFEFPWDDDAIIPASKFFPAAELTRDDPIAVGRSGDWIAFTFGQWVLYLKHDPEAKFPRYNWLLGDPATAQTALSLSDGDADFLRRSLDVMPVENDVHFPVTIDLNGEVGVRSRADKQSPPTEVVLTNSHFTGEAIRTSCNRRFLARALKFGFRRLSLNTRDASLFCDDGQRQYLWMPLEQAADAPPADNATRIESPVASQATAKSSTSRRRRTVPQTTRHPSTAPTTNDAAAATAPAASETSTPASVPQARKPRRKRSASNASTLDQAQAVCDVAEVLHEVQPSSYAWLYRHTCGRDEAALEIRSLVKTKTPEVESHRYAPRSPRHFRRLFAVIRAYLDDLDRGRFIYRPSVTCGSCEFNDTHCRTWTG